jgi:hypothetical protein
MPPVTLTPSASDLCLLHLAPRGLPCTARAADVVFLYSAAKTRSAPRNTSNAHASKTPRTCSWAEYLPRLAWYSDHGLRLTSSRFVTAVPHLMGTVGRQ